MKCKNCGGEVNTETMICEYCDSKYCDYNSKINNWISDKAKFFKMIAVISVIFFISIMGIGAVVKTFFTGAALTGALLMYSNNEVQQATQQQELLVNRLPESAFDLVGQMRECTTNGVAEIYYNDKFYSDVQILDSAFIDWMEKEGIGSDGMDIMFSTDENHNITSVYIQKPDFVVMYRDDDTYVAFREDEKIITFETDIELETDSWYTGYFHYSDKKFHNAVDSGCYESLGQFYYSCKEKDTTTEHCDNSDKEVTVYKLLVGDTWYYCSKNTYDSVSIGDELKDGYTFVLAKPYVYKQTEY